MNITTHRFLKSWLLSASAMAVFAFGLLNVTPVMAQDTAIEEESDESIEQITVTGTRIKRDTNFNSSAPLAVIDASEQIQFGAIDAASILRQSTSVSGQQIDSSFNGFGVDGGPGAETIALRGLGPERTLVLMDGRRIGAAGNFGAAVHPDLALIPSFLVDRAEILLSGASSIYGADAVAGVVNIITPTDFEGVQLDITYGNPSDGDGEEQVATLQFGGSSDRMRFFMGAEYFKRDGIRAGERSWGVNQRQIEIDDNGELLVTPDGFFDQTVVFGPDCTFAGYTPGQMLGGSTVPNYSCEGDGSPVDFDLPPWNTFDAYNAQHIWSPSTKWAGFASMEYDLEAFGNSAIFFQFLNSNRKQSAHGGDGQFFPLVPAENIYNFWGDDVVPVAFDRNSRSDTDDTSVHYERYVTGLKGDIPFLNDVANMDNWTYEFSVGYTRSEGKNNFDIVRQDRLVNSMNNCANPSQSTFSGASPDCVIVDLFGPRFITTGSFGPARDYLVARVTNNTTVSQQAWELGATGDLFELPAGPVGAFIGTSYRDDKINSNVDRNLEESNAWGRSAEGDTIGAIDISEWYVEFDVPILAGRTGAEDVGINMSYRISDDEFFGSEDTWRVTAHWDFTEYFRLRGTAGTSFRAPNVKELFVADQTGFTGAFIDPCIPPPGDDERSENIINNCLSEGVDPFTLGEDGAPSVETVSGGADDLRPETSESWSVGAVFSQPWTDSFDFQVAIDLTNLDIEDAVAEPGAGFILNQCYTSPNFSDPLCSRVTRQVDEPPDQRFLRQVDQSVANIEVEEYEDLSFSTLFVKDFSFRDKASTFTWDTDFTKTRENREGLFAETAEDLVGSISVPEWRIQSSERLVMGDWSISHRWNYFSDGQDTEGQQEDGGYPDGRVNSIGSMQTHSLSVSYTAEKWRVFLTVENAFDEEPDLIDKDAFVGNSINNLALGVYPSEVIFGRTVILSVRTDLF